MEKVDFGCATEIPKVSILSVRLRALDAIEESFAIKAAENELNGENAIKDFFRNRRARLKISVTREKHRTFTFTRALAQARR